MIQIPRGAGTREGGRRLARSEEVEQSVRIRADVFSDDLLDGDVSFERPAMLLVEQGDQNTHAMRSDLSQASEGNE